jgi:hypothetical protein
MTTTVACSALLFAACGAGKTTPAQDRAYALFAECQKETSAWTVQLQRVTPEGQMYAEGREGDVQRMQACMQSKGVQANPGGGAR